VIVDSSALLAVLLDELEGDRFIEILEATDLIRMSVASYLEATISLDRKSKTTRRASLDAFISEFEINLVPVTVEQIHIASDAFFTFGKGRHRAALNFGDRFSYALAKAYSEPLLFKGNDFSQTDIEAVQDRLQ
jgi:ribonuclease VapC